MTQNLQKVSETRSILSGPKNQTLKEFYRNDDSISNLDNTYFFIFEPLKINLVLLNIIQKWLFLKTGKKIHFQKPITI